MSKDRDKVEVRNLDEMDEIMKHENLSAEALIIVLGIIGCGLLILLVWILVNLYL